MQPASPYPAALPTRPVPSQQLRFARLSHAQGARPRPLQLTTDERRERLLSTYCRNYGPCYMYKSNVAAMDMPGTNDTSMRRKARG